MSLRDWWLESGGLEKILAGSIIGLSLLIGWIVLYVTVREWKIPVESREVAAKAETHTSGVLPQSIVTGNGQVGTILIPHTFTEHLLIATTGEVCPVNSRSWAAIENGERISCKWRSVK